MSDDGFADDVMVRIILDAARAAMNATDDPWQRKYLKSKIEDVLHEGASIEQLGRGDFFNIAVSLLQTGFEIGRSILSEEHGELALKALRSEAGRRSGEIRRAKAEAGWKAHATELAIALRGSLSQKNLASEIQASWKSGIVAPGHATLLLHVQDLQRAGVLPPKKRHNELAQ